MGGLSALIDALGSGDKIYIPGASGEIPGLANALSAADVGLNILTCALPGLNEIDPAGNPATHVTCFLLPKVLRQRFSEGRVDLVPITYSAIPSYIAEALQDGTAIVHVSPSDREGRCSFGIAADFGPDAWRAARRRIAVVNRKMPFVPGSPTIELAKADLVIEVDGELITPLPDSADEAAARIASIVAARIPDRAAVQAGIGGVPLAVWDALGDHRDVIVRSGIVTDAVMRLSSIGALADTGHVAGVAYGSADLYRWLADEGKVRFASTGETHAFETLARLPLFHAVNSALEVDLLGQVNLEWQAGRAASGVGGAADFAAAAIAAKGGSSIIALPSTARGGVSRIVVRLTAPAVSLPRYLADVVVTEWGAADIRKLGLDERARALIAIADPAHRSELDRGWHAARQGF